jgi:hypothetical protein
MMTGQPQRLREERRRVYALSPERVRELDHLHPVRIGNLKPVRIARYIMALDTCCRALNRRLR